MAPRVTSLNFHAGHDQPNYASYLGFVEKLSYRTPSVVLQEMQLEKLEAAKAKQRENQPDAKAPKDGYDNLVDGYTKLFEKEAKHQRDITMDN